MSYRQQFASIDPLCKLAYAERGNRTGAPIIFLPGFSDSWPSYAPLMDALPSSFRLIALSQCGHGDSDKPDDGYTVASYADDLAGFMNALDIRRAIVVGHSFGSLVATRFAMKYPDRVLSLGLLGAFRTLAGHPGVEELWNSAIAHAADVIDPAFVREFQMSTLARPIPSERLESAIAESQKMPGRTWKALCRHLLEDDFASELQRINTPTLIVWGQKDSFSTQDEQMQLHAALRGSKLVSIAEAGHAPHWEDPQGIARILSDFFAPQVAAAA